LPSLLFFPGIALVTIGLYMYAYSNWKRHQAENPLGKTLKPPQMQSLVKWSAKNIVSLKSRSDEEIEFMAVQAWRETRGVASVLMITSLLLAISLDEWFAGLILGSDYTGRQLVYLTVFLAAILGGMAGWIIQILLRKRMRQLTGAT